MRAKNLLAGFVLAVSMLTSAALIGAELGGVTVPDSVYYLTPTPRLEPIGATNIFERNQGIYTNLKIFIVDIYIEGPQVLTLFRCRRG